MSRFADEETLEHIASIEQKLTSIQDAMPDDFSEAKDWTFSNDLVARIEWLKAMYLNRKKDSEEAFEQLATAQAEVEAERTRRWEGNRIASDESRKEIAGLIADNLRLREALEQRASCKAWSTLSIIHNALSTTSGDLSALREVIAQVFEEASTGRSKYLAGKLRSGEWTPEVLK